MSKTATMRLDRFLGETTPLTRSLAKKALKAGEVTLNGQPVKQAAQQINPDEDAVTWLDEPLELIGKRYIMLHKPLEVECTARRGLYPRAIDLLDVPAVERLQPVGRLDVDTTGLLLLTDDGQWLHRITAPKSRCDKVYRATLADPWEGDPAAWAVERMAEGLLLEDDDRPTRPATLVMLSPVEAELAISEGRYHQVKRMFGALGNRVTALHRQAIGPLELDADLAPGEWRELSQEEVALF